MENRTEKTATNTAQKRRENRSIQFLYNVQQMHAGRFRWFFWLFVGVDGVAVEAEASIMCTDVEVDIRAFIQILVLDFRYIMCRFLWMCIICIVHNAGSYRCVCLVVVIENTNESSLLIFELTQRYKEDEYNLRYYIEREYAQRYKDAVNV